MKTKMFVLCGTLGLCSTSFANSYFSLSDDAGFKRFAASAGWLHVSPTGKAQPFNIQTSVNDGMRARVGDISMDSVINNLSDENDPISVAALVRLLNGLGADSLPASLSGGANIYNLNEWTSPDTGLEADSVNTLGLMMNYFFTDNVSLQVIAGIPPKVDIKGKGQISAPFKAIAQPELAGIQLGDLYLENNIPITDLDHYGTAATARAWTPALQMQYHFGSSKTDKFRPYIGAGVMYAYFNELELNKGIESDLVAAGHMIQNIHDNQAGAALDGKLSSGDPYVKLDASDVFAPIVSAGFTYDFKPNWFMTASVSYAQLENEATIKVLNRNNGSELINAKTDIEINPVIGYLGVGYRF